jgi:peptidyl-prolyl cis-trans isomerase C
MSKKNVVGLGAVVLLVASVVVFSGCEKSKAAQVAKKDVVATVGNKVITMQDVDARIAKMPAYYQNMLKDRKKDVLEDMVLEILFYNEAKKRGLQNDKEVKEMVEEAQKKIMVSKLVRDEIETKVSVSDKEAEAYYNAHKEEFNIPERWKASHILVKTEDEAKAVLADIAKGKSFEDEAKEKSQDTSAKKGGDLGYFTKGQMVPEFEDAVVKLDVGQTSGIVKSQFGYHIIKLVDKKPAQPQEFKDASERIKNELLATKRRDAFDKIVAGLKARTKVTTNDSLFETAPKTEDK